METAEFTGNNTLMCDRCGRLIGNKGYLSIDGWIICGICQWEVQQKTQPQSQECDHVWMSNGACMYCGELEYPDRYYPFGKPK